MWRPRSESIPDILLAATRFKTWGREMETDEPQTLFWASFVCLTHEVAKEIQEAGLCYFALCLLKLQYPFRGTSMFTLLLRLGGFAIAKTLTDWTRQHAHQKLKGKTYTLRERERREFSRGRTKTNKHTTNTMRKQYIPNHSTNMVNRKKTQEQPQPDKLSNRHFTKRNSMTTKRPRSISEVTIWTHKTLEKSIDTSKRTEKAFHEQGGGGWSKPNLQRAELSQRHKTCWAHREIKQGERMHADQNTENAWKCLEGGRAQGVYIEFQRRKKVSMRQNEESQTPKRTTTNH